METPDKTKSPSGWFTVLVLLITKDLIFLGLQYHAPVIAPLLNPSLVPVKEVATAGLTAVLRITASNVCHQKGIKSVLHQLIYFTGIMDEQKRTQHTSLWHDRNDWGPLTSSTINHDSLHAVGEELPTNGQHTATYTNRQKLVSHKLSSFFVRNTFKSHKKTRELVRN